MSTRCVLSTRNIVLSTTCLTNKKQLAVQLYESLNKVIKPEKKASILGNVYNYAFISPRYFALDATNIHWRKEPYPIFPLFQNQLFPLFLQSSTSRNYYDFMSEIHLTLDLNENPHTYEQKTITKLIEICSELPNLQSFIFKKSLEHTETITFHAQFHENSFPKLKYFSFEDNAFFFDPSFFRKYLKYTSHLEVLFLKGIPLLFCPLSPPSFHKTHC